MKRADRLAVVDRVGDHSVVYDIVLLAGSPRRHTLRLAPDIAEESVIEVDGDRWVVADVRSVEGAPPQLICIYDV